MPSTRTRTIGLAIPFLALAGMTQASIISATFQENLDLPSYSSSGPRVEQALNVALPSVGPQLTASDITSNPSGWVTSLNVSFDSATNVLSLTGDLGGAAYQLITVELSGLQFDAAEQVNGFTPLSTGNAVPLASGVFNVTTSFTADSVTVSYLVNPVALGNYFLLTGDTDTFQLSLGSQRQSTAPEPSSLALIGLGMAGLLALGRKAPVRCQALD